MEAAVRISGPLVGGLFIARPNRFAAVVSIDGNEEVVHVPNSGRLTELLVPGRPVLLRAVPKPSRKTRYDMALVGLEHTLVSADARLPAALFAEAVAQGRLPRFRGYAVTAREVTLGKSRLDLLLSGPRSCLVETKSITLVEGGAALFPDAVTERGARHLRTLVQARAEGYEAAVVFVIQRPDASCFVPNDAADPLFGQTLREAARAGVEVHAYACGVALDEIALTREVPVFLKEEACGR